MQNLANLQNLRALGHKGFNSEPVIKFLSSLVNSKGGVYFPFQENASEGAELLVDGDMEAATADVWIENDSITSKQTTDPHGGIRLLRVAYTDNNICYTNQDILTSGKRYKVTGWVRGDGAGLPTVYFNNVLIFTGIASASWQYFEGEDVSDGVGFWIGSDDLGVGDYTEWDDISVVELTNDPGDVSLAVNPALALGRDLVINGDFADWTTDDPDDWTVQEAGDATSNVTQNPAGECQIISDGTQVFIIQTMLEIGKTYIATMDVNAITGTLKWSAGSATENITTTGAKSFAFTAQATGFSIARSGVVNATIDNVTVKQTNILASTDFPGSEELTNGSMEAGDPPTAWVAANSATLSSQTGTRTGGSGTKVIRVARNGVDLPFARQVIIMTIGKRYRVIAWTRSDGNATPRIQDDGGGGIHDGTTDTAWQLIDFEFTAIGTGLGLVAVASGTEYVEWDDVSVTEANPLNGDITGAFIDQSAGSKLKKSYLFDGTNDFVNIHSAEINSIFDPTKGTLLAFAKVSGAGVWSDGADGELIRLLVDGSNFVFIDKTSTANQLRGRYAGGGTQDTVTIATSTTDWFMLAMTWDTSGGGALKVYFNGVQSGSTQTGLGTWVGNFPSTNANIGAGSTSPSLVFDGNIAHTTLLTEVLSASDILKISNLAGTT